MYSSLHKIDVTASTPNGPLYVQTDHRSADEIAADPEISTLFALTRLLFARAYGAEQPGPGPMIVYASIGEVPDFLVEVIASACARLTVGDTHEYRELAAVDVAPATLADRAFAALAARVQRRVGLTDPAAALKALEAETLAIHPTPKTTRSCTGRACSSLPRSSPRSCEHVEAATGSNPRTRTFPSDSNARTPAPCRVAARACRAHQQDPQAGPRRRDGSPLAARMTVIFRT